MAKNNRVLIYGSLVAGIVIVWFATAPDETSPRERNRPNRTPVERKKDRKLEAFNDEDKNASYLRLNTEVANIFKPIVVRGSAKAGSQAQTKPNQVPPYMVGGDTNWFYTGTAYIDNVPTALVENTATGQGQYLKVGEVFMNARVTRITPNTLAISTSDGLAATTLTLLENRPIVEDPGMSIAGNQPINPLSGPIGLNANDRPAESTRNAELNDTTNTENNTNESPN